MITNLGGNYDFGMVLCFGLVWLFCYMDGLFFDFVILWDPLLYHGPRISRVFVV